MPPIVLEIIHNLFNADSWYGAIFYGVAFLAAAIAIARLVRITAERLMTHENLVDPTVMTFLTQFAQILVYVLALIFFFHVIPALNKLGTALLTGVSVMSVIFGLAAQNTLGNLVAGLTLMLYRPFHLDDLIQVATPTGTEVGILERLTLGYTMLRTLDDRLVVVPNSLMASQVSLNLNRGAVHSMVIVPIGVVDPLRVREVREALLEAARNHPLVHRVVGCPAKPLEDGAVVLSLRAWCENRAGADKVKADITEIVERRFAANHIRLLTPDLPTPAPEPTKAAA
jgi:small-conductance mechanosensitive channel